MKPQWKILLAEDDPNLGEILREYLAAKGYQPTRYLDGEQALKGFYAQKFDLCILDLMMPKKDGFTLASEIRQVNSEIPIIFLTAKSLKEDVIKGFKIGGDDYLTKPFSMEELIMRIDAIMKRVGKENVDVNANETIDVGLLRHQYNQSTLWINKEKIKLTTKENELLRLLLENKNKTVSRSFALRKIWGDDTYFNARSMDVYIAKIRKMISTIPSLKIITVHGEGFKLIETESDVQ